MRGGSQSICQPCRQRHAESRTPKMAGRGQGLEYGVCRVILIFDIPSRHVGWLNSAVWCLEEEEGCALRAARNRLRQRIEICPLQRRRGPLQPPKRELVLNPRLESAR
jgi:hypothetical protein